MGARYHVLLAGIAAQVWRYGGSESCPVEYKAKNGAYIRTSATAGASSAHIQTLLQQALGDGGQNVASATGYLLLRHSRPNTYLPGPPHLDSFDGKSALKQAPTHCCGTDRFLYHVSQAWVLVDQQLYGVPLRVPRSFYVDSDLEPEAAAAALAWEGAHVARVKRLPPGGRHAKHMYQVSLQDSYGQLTHHGAQHTAGGLVRLCGT